MPPIRTMLLCLLAAAATPGGLRAEGEGLFVSAFLLRLDGVTGGPTAVLTSFQVTTVPPNFDYRIQRTSPSPWLTLSANSNRTPATVTATVDFTGFAEGEQRSTVLKIDSLEAQFPNFKAEIQVLAVFSAAGPAPRPITDPLFLALSGTARAPIPLTSAITVRNASAGAFSYSFRVDYPFGGQPGWLFVNPGAGLFTGTPIEHEVIANVGALEGGEHRALLTLEHNAAGAPMLNIPVTLTLKGPPEIAASPPSIEATAVAGEVLRLPGALTVGNAGGGEFDYVVTATRPWLRVAPPGGKAVEDGAVEHAIEVDAGALEAGVHEAELTVVSAGAAAVNSPLTIPFRLILNQAGSLGATSAGLSFHSAVGKQMRERRAVALSSPDAEELAWRASLDPPGLTWVRLLNPAGRTPAVLLVEVDTTRLPAGRRDAEIVISAATETPRSALSAEGFAQQGALTVRVPVELILEDAAPGLRIEPERVLFTTTEEASAALRRTLRIENRGAGSLNWEARIANGSPWLAVDPTAGATPAALHLSADAAGLAAGVYEDRIVVNAGPHRIEVPVALVVQPSAAAAVEPVPTSLRFRAEQGAGRLPAEIVRLTGAGTWTARMSTTSGGDWLILGPQQDLETGVGLEVAAEAGYLAPGRYFGLIEFESLAQSDALGVVTVVLDVAPAEERPVLSLSPGGFAFAAEAGGAMRTARLELRSSGPRPEEFRFAASTHDGGDWLQAAAPAKLVSAALPAALDVTLDPGGLAPGIYRGQVAAALDNGEILAAPVVLTVFAATASVARAAQGDCAARGPTAAVLAPPLNFTAQSGEPTRLTARVIDGCGAEAAQAAVTAIFSNGDAAVALAPLGGGLWGGTWTPASAGEQVNVEFWAAASGVAAARAVTVGTVAEGSRPRIFPGGIVNGAGFAAGRPVSPGAIVSLFGTEMAQAAAAAGEIPLPRALAGSSAVIAGVEAPLFFVSAGQINLQAPYEIAANAVRQAYLRRGAELSVPQYFIAAAAQPELFALDPRLAGEGRAVALNEDLSLNTPSNPAARGSVVTLFLSGQGLSEPSLASGAAAPSDGTLLRPALPSSARIAGRAAEILFLGLTPGFVGLTQANLRVPAGIAADPNVDVEVEIGGRASARLLIAVGP